MWPEHRMQRGNTRFVKKNIEASLEDTYKKLKILDFVSESDEDLLICCCCFN